MKHRAVLPVLAVAVCASVALGTLDVSIEILSPRDTEQPGLVPVTVRLTNLGDVPALVPRVDVTILPSSYADYEENIAIGVGSNQSVSMNPWVCSGLSEETCTAWITYPGDSNHSNDTDIVIVNRASGLFEGSGADLSMSPGLLTGSIARSTCCVSHTEPLNVTLFDIKGRRAAKYCLGAKEFSLDLRDLKSGVYFVRLDDGRSAVTQKLVVQR